MKNLNEIIPNHIQIEIVNGYCNFKCIMCSWPTWKRKPLIMSTLNFEIIIKKFEKYLKNIKYLSLHGCGEPLIDLELEKKITLASKFGFSGIGFSTNAMLLSKERSEFLIMAGLNTLIVSIDGVNPTTYEKIRIGGKYDTVVNNIITFIKIRNQLVNSRLITHKCRIIIRFLRMEQNFNEWELFERFWTEKINSHIGDVVARFDARNCGGINNFQEVNAITKEPMVCNELFHRMRIYANGDVGLCCVDDIGIHAIGNVLCDDPITLYNSDIFKTYRENMEKGNISQLELCNQCDHPQKRANRTEIPDY